MPHDIKIWEIEKDSLREIKKAKLNLEERLEDWIEKDISIISNDLLIIGRQVTTAYDKQLDLLCVDYRGDLVILELKRDKTTREITAQILDYACWVKDLSNDQISEIADDYLKDKGPLDKAFKEKFNKEIPEILNEHHKMIIIASNIDIRSERIVEYLSSTYGVSINAATFRYMQDSGKEYLARVFLIEPSEAEYRTSTKAVSKRKPKLSPEELEKIAEDNGAGDLFRRIKDVLLNCFDFTDTTLSSMFFARVENNSKKTIFSICPFESNEKQGIKYKVYIDRLTDYFDIKKESIVNILPTYKKVKDGDGGEHGEGYIENDEQAEKFIFLLAEKKNKN